MNFVVDTNTPTTVAASQEFVKSVEKLGERITVNSVYPQFKTVAESGQTMWRPGRAFCFWFQTDEEAKNFVKEWGGSLKPYVPVDVNRVDDKGMIPRVV